MVGPNLANVGARSYIAAGLLKNTDENLAQWIRDPQGIKNGVLMPNLGVSEPMRSRWSPISGRTSRAAATPGQLTTRQRSYGNQGSRSAQAHAAAHGEKTGLWSWITTVDHKRIGILYGATAFFFFLMGGIEALLLRIQLGAAGQHLPVARDLQPAVHDARHDHDLPRDHAAVGDVLQLHDSAADRRPGRGLPPAQCVQLLGVSARAACSSTRAGSSGTAPNGAGSATPT